MSTSDVFPTDISFPVEETVHQKVLVSDFDSGQEKRKQKWAQPKRRWRISAATLNDTELAALIAFWEAREGAYDIFSFLPPYNQGRLITGVACGTGDAIETEFKIGGASPAYYYRPYLGAGTRNQAYVDGSPTAATFAVDDATYLPTITFSGAPGDGTVITCDVDIYRIVRFGAENFRNQLTAYALANAEFELVEIFRDSIA